MKDCGVGGRGGGWGWWCRNVQQAGRKDAEQEAGRWPMPPGPEFQLPDSIFYFCLFSRDAGRRGAPFDRPQETRTCPHGTPVPAGPARRWTGSLGGRGTRDPPGCPAGWRRVGRTGPTPLVCDALLPTRKP